MSEVDGPDGGLDPLFELGPEHPRRRLVEATVRCLEDTSLAELGLAGVAERAGMSRATLYRWFPDGRDELLRVALAAEVAEFWRGLAAAVADETTLVGRVTRGLMEGVRRTGDHALLQRLVNQEAEDFAPYLDEVDPMVFELLASYLSDLLTRFESDVAPEVDRGEAARYLATMILSYLGSPARIDFGDEARVDHLVRTQLLGGILA
ncbi:MAG: TetR/AcrR family transcriptional regulator [Microthrixaceae bacterium]|nr:TetR/AcrR family transcriptional regulator [Microthrixaceae bacterium]